MAFEFSLDGKRITQVLASSIVLLILTFMAGWISGVIMGASHSVKQPARRADYRKEVPRRPARTPAAGVRQKIVDKPRIQPAPTPMPQAAVQTPQKPREIPQGEAHKPLIIKPLIEQPETRGGAFSVQVGAYLKKKNAERYLGQLKEKGYDPYIFETSDRKKREWYLVRIGDYPDSAEAFQATSDFKKQEKMPALVTAIDSMKPVSQKKKKAPPGGTKPGLKPEGAPKGAVKKEAKKEETPGPEMGYSVQVGTFVVEQNAVKMTNNLKLKGYPASILNMSDSKGKVRYVVQIGDYKDHDKAVRIASDFMKKEKDVSVVVPIASSVLKDYKKPPAAEDTPKAKPEVKPEAKGKEAKPVEKGEKAKSD